MTVPDLRYPIGRYAAPLQYDAVWRAARIDEMAALPAQLRAAVRGLSEAQLEAPYRPGGWTVRQVVHHVADSHLNMYLRLKWALTESTPTIKPYDEVSWAELPDTRLTPVDVSLTLVEALHDRCVRLLRAMHEGDFERRYVHPDSGEHPLNHMVGLYAWHGRHHVAHVTSLRDRMGWS